MLKMKAAALLTVACSLCSTALADTFSDVKNMEQVGAWNLGGQASDSAAGHVFPPIHGMISSPNNSTQSFGIDARRRQLMGRTAIIVKVSPFQVGLYSQASVGEFEFRIVQNGKIYWDVYFHAGQFEQCPARIGKEDAKIEIISWAPCNLKAVDTVVLAQSGQQGEFFNPNAAFDLYYNPNWVNDAAKKYVLTMPAYVPPAPPRPTVSASFSSSTIFQGATYSISTTTSNATSLRMTCTGAMSSDETLSVGTATVNRTATELGTTQCTFTATGPGGQATTTASRTVVESGKVPPPSNPCVTNPRACM